MSSTTFTKTLADDAATQALGAAMAPLLRVGDVLCLTGDLGAGKTTFSRGLIKALCETDDVPSPTYTLLQTYVAPDFEIWHFDLYRIKSPSEIWELGMEDALYDGVCLIEWPQRMEGLKPEGTLDIDITFDGEGRKASFTYPASWAERLDSVRA